ncbi:MAG: DNA gyrase inhibitor YacG [Pseudomonadota bacterium]
MSCPICKRPVVAEYRPFCSRRCADIDLGRWLTGGYAIPTDEGEDDATDGAPRDRTDDPTGRLH